MQITVAQITVLHLVWSHHIRTLTHSYIKYNNKKGIVCSHFSKNTSMWGDPIQTTKCHSFFCSRTPSLRDALKTFHHNLFTTLPIQSCDRRSAWAPLVPLISHSYCPHFLPLFLSKSWIFPTQIACLVFSCASLLITLIRKVNGRAEWKGR